MHASGSLLSGGPAGCTPKSRPACPRKPNTVFKTFQAVKSNRHRIAQTVMRPPFAYVGFVFGSFSDYSRFLLSHFFTKGYLAVGRRQRGGGSVKALLLCTGLVRVTRSIVHIQETHNNNIPETQNMILKNQEFSLHKSARRDE